MSLTSFIKKIPNFDTLTSSNKIDFFLYYLLFDTKKDGIRSKDIEACFEELHLQPYSNIRAYLNNNAKRGKTQKFLKRGDNFFLENSTKVRIETIVVVEPVLEPTDNLFPLSIFNNTRGYLVAFATEASCAYDYGLYNSCFFMLRKLMETLIIELFERHGIDSKIKNSSGGYFFLSDLIGKLVGETTWHLTKITREDLPKIKKFADSSVHSKRFAAKKTDIDNMKTEIRIIYQELVSLIDYPNWQ